MAFQDSTPVGGQDAPFNDVVEVLNYALTLEHLESAFYRQALEQFTEDDFVNAGYVAGVRGFFELIGEHEAEHVTVLTSVIESLDGEPVQEAEYDFGVSDVASFLQTAAALENTGLDAYTGAAQYLIEEDELLTAALTIHGVEGRHAAYLDHLLGNSPFPAAFEEPLTPAEVLEIAGPFIVSE